MAKTFVALHSNSVARPSAYVVLQVICHKFCRIILPTFILTYEGQSERIFSFIGFPEIVQYLSTGNIAQLHNIDLYGNIF